MINCDGLVKIYETDDKKVMALEGLDLSVETGDMVIEGEINAVIYGDSQVKGPLGFVGRLLK